MIRPTYNETKQAFYRLRRGLSSETWREFLDLTRREYEGMLDVAVHGLGLKACDCGTVECLKRYEAMFDGGSFE